MCMRVRVSVRVCAGVSVCVCVCMSVHRARAQQAREVWDMHDIEKGGGQGPTRLVCEVSGG